MTITQSTPYQNRKGDFGAYITSRNSYCKCVMTSTAKSKRIFKNYKLYTKNEDECPMLSLLLIDLVYIYIHIYKTFLIPCLVAKATW